MVAAPLPPGARNKLGADAPTSLAALGNAELLKAPLLGLLCSRECPGHIILDVLDRVPGWVAEGRVLVSGFHAPLEQQVLRSLLRREGQAVKVLARGLPGARLSADERAACTAGRMAIVSAFATNIRRVTRHTAHTRNQLVAALAHELFIPYTRPGSPLEALHAATAGV